MNDAANSIATVVSTRVLRPQYAVAWAAFFNFIAFLVFGLHVAETVGRGIVQADIVDARVIFGALAGAITWQIITNRLGIPSSSSHALIGGLVGAGARQGRRLRRRVARRRQDQRRHRAGAGARLRGRAVADAARVLGLRALHALRGRQYFPPRCNSSRPRCYSLGHGGNDAQKTMGIIAVLLYSQGYLGAKFYVPFWVVIACQAAMAIGTLVGGWRIVRTMGSKITRLTPVQGCLRRNRRLDHAVRRDLARHSGVDHAHHHRLDHRRRRREEGVGGALGRRQRHRHRLDHHDPGRGG